MRRRIPAVDIGSSAVYGIATSVVLDEFVNPVLGLAARADRYPWHYHARELTAHVIYGLVINAVSRFFDRESETTRLTQHASHLMASPFTTNALPDVA